MRSHRFPGANSKRVEKRGEGRENRNNRNEWHWKAFSRKEGKKERKNEKRKAFQTRLIPIAPVHPTPFPHSHQFMPLDSRALEMREGKIKRNRRSSVHHLHLIVVRH
jgi:hypothetical protein